jgi:uncharacterized membrane protein YgdD (TMEM256/DUF423 family)
MQPARFVILGGLLAALAVGLGALGAHALKSQLTPEHLVTFQTAVQYQMYHAIGLVLVGLLSLCRHSRWFDFSGWSVTNKLGSRLGRCSGGRVKGERWRP